MALEATTVNRRYRVEGRLGEGGMAEVSLGHDLLLNRPVAIKKLHHRYADDAALRARFEREAERAASLTHPNIIEIYDVGDDNGRPYIVMEYVAGDTLKQIILEEGPFNPDDVAALLEQVAFALDYAHERGIVHRDVKPQNILVDTVGLAKVVDFGIAKGLSDASLTDLGAALGTAHYVSPEQASGLMATPSSDIYSLGVVAFEMLTRHVPFDGDSSINIAIQHIEDAPPSPSALQPYLASSVDDIVQRALAKNPTLRYRSAGEFASAMSDWRSNSVEPRHDAAAAPRSAAETTVLSSVAQPVPTPRTPYLPSDVLPGTKDMIGRGTWFVGTAVLVALIVLVWFGASLSEGRLGTSENVITTATEATSPGNARSLTESAGAGAVVQTATSAAQIAVPSVTGMDLASAIGALTNIGLLVQEGQPIFSQQVAAGDVAEQDPPAGSATSPGQTVVIKPSLGSPGIDLASLALEGRSLAEARQIVEDQGLNAVTEDVSSDVVASGYIVAIDPESSASVGDTVTLFISTGP